METKRAMDMENRQASQNEKIVVTAAVVVEKLVVEEVVVTAVVVMAVKNVLQVTAILVNGPIAPIMSPNNNAVIIMDTMVRFLFLTASL